MYSTDRSSPLTKIAHSWAAGVLRVGEAITLTGIIWVIAPKNNAIAQLETDGTLGSEASVVTPNVIVNGGLADRIDGGATRSATLFHSFQEFNVNSDRSVFFANPAGIETIITRVTGTNSSTILGTLGVTGGNADLFLINPNGIIFGANASLSLNGSFVASTADSVIFTDGTLFSAKTPQPAPLLTVSVPIGLQFGSTPGTIQVEGTGNNFGVIPAQPTPLGLQLQPGQTLALVGGNLLFNGGILTVPEGRLELGAVASEGVVDLTPTSQGWSITYDDISTFGDILLSQRALVDGSGDRLPTETGLRSSAIQVTGRRLRLSDGSQIRAANTGATKGGSIVINATESIEILGNTELKPNTFIGTTTLQESQGDAGDIQIHTGRLLIQNRGILEASSTGAGGAGDITIAAKEVDVVGRHIIDNDRFSSLNAEAENLGTAAGTITIIAERVQVQGGGRIAANAAISGDGGNIKIDTKELIVSDEGSRIEAVSTAYRLGELLGTIPTGESGSIEIRATDLVLLSDHVYFPNRPSGLVVHSAGRGDAGNLRIDTRRLIVEGGTVIEASATFSGEGGGNGGNLIINASESVELIGYSRLSEAPSILTTESLGTGKAGDLEINTRRLIIRDGAQASVRTFGSGNGGNLTVNASQDVQLIGTFDNTRHPNGLFTTSTGNGMAGNLTIETGALQIRDRAQVSVDSFGLGEAGNLMIIADSIALDTQSELSAETLSTNGGNITLQIQDFLLMRRGSRISTTAGTAKAGGDGGNITINAALMVAVPDQNNDITANAFSGQGGRVTLTTQGLYNFTIPSRDEIKAYLGSDDLSQFDTRQLSSNDITAISQLSPQLSQIPTLNLQGVDPVQGLVKLPEDIVDVTRLVEQNLCQAAQGSKLKG